MKTNNATNFSWEYRDEHLFDNDYDQWLDETMASRPLPTPSDSDFIF